MVCEGRVALAPVARAAGSHIPSRPSGWQRVVTSSLFLLVLMPTVCGGRSRSARPAPCVSMLIGSNSWGAEGVEQVGLVEIYGGATSSYAGIPSFRGRTAADHQDEEEDSSPSSSFGGPPAVWRSRSVTVLLDPSLGVGWSYSRESYRIPFRSSGIE